MKKKISYMAKNSHIYILEFEVGLKVRAQTVALAYYIKNNYHKYRNKTTYYYNLLSSYKEHYSLNTNKFNTS